MSARVALVTGGGRGIGAAAVSALASAGHSVAVGDLLDDAAAESAAAARAEGASAVACRLDVTDGDSVREAFDRVTEELGPIDVLVNCAGWDEFRSFLDTDEPFWRRVIAVNYEGCLRTTQAVLAGMAERQWGRVVNVSSDAARVGSAQEAVYAGAKAGVIAFTKTVAREFARSGVTANAVCPGPTDTDLLRQMAEGAPTPTGSSRPFRGRCRCAASGARRRWRRRSRSSPPRRRGSSRGRRCRSAAA